MPSECRGCDYVFQPLCETYYCQYILKTGHHRPCKAGKGCTVRRTRGVARVPISISRPGEKEKRKRMKPKWHKEARKMYEAGKNDGEISRALSMHVSTIHKWRQDLKLPANSKCGREAVASRGRPKGEAAT